MPVGAYCFVLGGLLLSFPLLLKFALYILIVELRTPAMPVGVGEGKREGDFI